MGDFEIYADALEHPLLQRFNDLLNLLSLSHYVNFSSRKMGHTLELGMLLNLHHSNILLFFSFAFVSSLWTNWRFLSLSLLFLWCLPAAQGSVMLLNQRPCMKTALRASQSHLPGPSLSLLVVSSVSPPSLSCMGFLLAVPSLHSLGSTSCQAHSGHIDIYCFFFFMKLRFTSLYFCKQKD